MKRQVLCRVLGIACAALLLAACGPFQAPIDLPSGGASAASGEPSSAPSSSEPASSAPSSSAPASSVPSSSAPASSAPSSSKPASSAPSSSAPASSVPSASKPAQAPSSREPVKPPPAPSEAPAADKKPITFQAGQVALSLSPGSSGSLRLATDPPDCAVTVTAPAGVRVTGSAPDYTITLDSVPAGDFEIVFSAKKEGWFSSEYKLRFSAPGGESSAPADSSGFADEVFRLTNEQRAANGLPALKRMPEVDAGANIRAREIVGTFSHKRPDGTSFYTVFGIKEGENYYYGENIAAGQASPSEVMTSWMNSPGHRANILNADYTGLGIGFCQDGGRCYWVQIFYHDAITA